MKSIIKYTSLALAFLGCVFCFNSYYAFAEDLSEADLQEAAAAATSISITPVSDVVTLTPSTVYENTFKVTNNGAEPMEFEVYAAPYSYTATSEEGDYSLNFAHEGNYTQITRWITVKGPDGNYSAKPVFTAESGSSVEVTYRITTPESVPAGGQYAVIFAHTISGTMTSSGIKTEASPGLVIYGRSTGETVRSAEISNLSIEKEIVTVNSVDGSKSSTPHINATAKIKNTGNIDFTATGTLKVEGILGRSYYETPLNASAISVIPNDDDSGTTLTLKDEWKETPFFGLFNVTWKVVAAGETQEVTRVVLIMPVILIIVMLILLTAIVIWIIILVRKRKERRSRFMV